MAHPAADRLRYRPHHGFTHCSVAPNSHGSGCPGMQPEPTRTRLQRGGGVMTRDFRGFGSKGEEKSPNQPQQLPRPEGLGMCMIVENDPKVPWVIAIFLDGPNQGERTYLFPSNWTDEMQERALLEWGVEE
jgi:hypothetical protein